MPWRRVRGWLRGGREGRGCGRYERRPGSNELRARSLLSASPHAAAHRALARRLNTPSPVSSSFARSVVRSCLGASIALITRAPETNEIDAAAVWLLLLRCLLPLSLSHPILVLLLAAPCRCVSRWLYPLAGRSRSGAWVVIFFSKRFFSVSSRYPVLVYARQQPSTHTHTYTPPWPSTRPSSTTTPRSTTSSKTNWAKGTPCNLLASLSLARAFSHAACLCVRPFSRRRIQLVRLGMARHQEGHQRGGRYQARSSR